MHNSIVSFAFLIVIASVSSADVWGNGGHSNYGVEISAASAAADHGPDRAPNGHIYHSNYQAPDYGHAHGGDNIFVKPRRTFDKHSKYNEKVLRKAYNDFIDNKLALKKRLFTNIVHKTLDKTVDVTASMTKNVVDFITKISIDAAANFAKNGAKAVLHKKEDKFNGNYHH